jgi:enolase
MPTISRLAALEILDSRARPTVRATCTLDSGATGVASVPSGASTGAAEAHELRDGEPRRYRGLGCRLAVAAIQGEIQAALAGHDYAGQAQLDFALRDLDGTPHLSRLGANAVLGVSLAFARAAAAERNLPLYTYFADLMASRPATLPRPLVQLFSGGKHAGEQIPIQSVEVCAVSAADMGELLAMSVETFTCAAELVRDRYGMRLLTADEGGLAPAFESSSAALDLAIEAIRLAGLRCGDDMALAVDVASSHFYREGAYHIDGDILDGAGMVGRLFGWMQTYPIIYVEDGLAEDDWEHWPLLRSGAPPAVLICGDDLLCTNPERVDRAIAADAANAMLLKLNQVGTVSEAGEACRRARCAGWRVVAAARSGDTEDAWLADVAAGWGAEHLRVGSITQSERQSKYNRLLEIEQEARLPLACAGG